MKTVYIIGFLLFTHLAKAQETNRREIDIGIDVSKPFLSAINKKPFHLHRFYTIEPVARIQLKDPKRYLQLQGGYTKYNDGQAASRTYINLTGYFLKAGVEWHYNHTIMALMATVSHWQTAGYYEFVGNYFGSYRDKIPSAQGTAIGIEWQVAVPIRITTRSSVRLLGHSNLLAAYEDADNIHAPYLPGTGIATQKTIRIGAGFSLQYVYRLRPTVYENR